MRSPVVLACGAMLAACASAPVSFPLAPAADVGDPPETSRAEEPTRILDRDTAYRLENNSGITLQWISWDYRGDAAISRQAENQWFLSARQNARRGVTPADGFVSVAGRIAEIGRDYFLLDGRIRIEDAPDVGRRCDETGTWRFAVTQNRKYWRLRDFEWCDGLTDYIDIYF